MFSCGVFIGALEFGDSSVKYLEQISRLSRGAFTQNEVYTADYLGRILRDLGYNTVFEEIIFPDDTVLNFEVGDYISHNIIATKEGKSDMEIVIGAPYDSVGDQGSTGFEAATGVGLLIELADKFKDITLPYTLKFVLFGAGKYGSIGSTHYVSTRSQGELNKIMYYLNLSSLGSGKELCIYSNYGNKGFLREDFLRKAKELNIDLSTSPAIEDYYVPQGVGYDIGDHVPFKYSNVPYGFIEATSWDSVNQDYLIPDDPTGEKLGIIDGSSKDNYSYVMDSFGENVRNNLAKASELIYNSIMKNEKSIRIITLLTNENLGDATSINYTLYEDGKKIKTVSLDDELSPIEFNNLSDGVYKIKVEAPSEISFVKDISEFEFDFDSDGEFVIVNDEMGVYTYRKEFTDNYISVRQNVQKSQFSIGVKDFLFDYSGMSQGDQQDSSNGNDGIIKVLFTMLAVLVILYIILRIVFFKMNKRLE